MTQETTLLLDLAADLNLPPVLVQNDKRPAWVKSSVNGVKFEIEYRYNRYILIVAFGDAKNSALLCEEFAHLAEPRNTSFWFMSSDWSKFASVAIQVHDFIIGNELSGTFGNRRVKLRTDDEGYFLKTAKVIELAVSIEHWDLLERGGLGFDAHDGLITIGSSKAVLDNPESPQWREHLVPCVMIKDRAVELFQNGASVTEVAQMLKENLAIVIITQEEAKTVDVVYQTTMPTGWQWGDSVFSRLDVVGIVY